MLRSFGGLPVQRSVRPSRGLLFTASFTIAVVAAATFVAFRSPAGEAPAAENRNAMERMMKQMDASHSGNVDRDFAAMMIPHHQGAVDMALVELRHGHNERLRRLAQGIVVEQQQEIAALQAVLDDELTPSEGTLGLVSLCRAPPP